jgi:hypothetical protein
MPLVRPCPRRWCPNYAGPGGYCADHQPAPFAGTAPMAPGWAAARAAAWTRDGGRCTSCGGPAAEVHHLRARSAGGTDHVSNLTSLCHPCHLAATAAARRTPI